MQGQRDFSLLFMGDCVELWWVKRNKKTALGDNVH